MPEDEIPEEERFRPKRFAHQWIGENWEDNRIDLLTQVLCVERTRDVELFWFSEDTVTKIREDVNCPECLEWIHA